MILVWNYCYITGNTCIRAWREQHIYFVIQKKINETETEANTAVLSSSYNNKADARNAVLNAQYLGGNTNTSGGLRVMHSNVFTTQNGDRPNVMNIALVITDGKLQGRQTKQHYECQQRICPNMKAKLDQLLRMHLL